MTCTVIAGSDTRRCPWRSTNRARIGALTALVSANAPDTAPASPYESVCDSTRITMPSPTIEIGIRATKPAAENARAPGVARTRR